jgi:hypothetical protein
VNGLVAATGVKAMVGSVLMALVVVTTGCGASSSTEELRLSLRDTRTAVASTQLAIDLFEQHRTTKAAAQVTAGDMVDQIGLVQQQLVDASGDTPAQRELRRRCQIVVTDALTAVQNSEDALAAPGNRAGAGADLPRVQDAVDAALAVVGER